MLFVRNKIAAKIDKKNSMQIVKELYIWHTKHLLHNRNKWKEKAQFKWRRPSNNK